MRPIPKKMREEMNDDPFYSLCCVRDISTCKGVIEWHHNLIHASRQVNEKFCILPMCELHHSQVHLPMVKGFADAVMISRASDEQIDKYGLEQRRKYLKNDSPWDVDDIL